MQAPIDSFFEEGENPAWSGCLPLTSIPFDRDENMCESEDEDMLLDAPNENIGLVGPSVVISDDAD